MEDEDKQSKIFKNSLISNMFIKRICFRNEEQEPFLNTKKVISKHNFKSSSLQYSLSALRSKFTTYPTISSNMHHNQNKIQIKEDLPTLTSYKSKSIYFNSLDKKCNTESNSFISNTPINSCPSDKSIKFNKNTFKDLKLKKNKGYKSPIIPHQLKIISKKYREIGIGTSDQVSSEGNLIRKRKQQIQTILSKPNNYFGFMKNNNNQLQLLTKLNSPLSKIVLYPSNKTKKDFKLQSLPSERPVFSKLFSNKTITKALMKYSSCKKINVVST